MSVEAENKEKDGVNGDDALASWMGKEKKSEQKKKHLHGDAVAVATCNHRAMACGLLVVYISRLPSLADG